MAHVPGVPETVPRAVTPGAYFPVGFLVCKATWLVHVYIAVGFQCVKIRGYAYGYRRRLVLLPGIGIKEEERHLQVQPHRLRPRVNQFLSQWNLHIIAVTSDVVVCS